VDNRSYAAVPALVAHWNPEPADPLERLMQLGIHFANFTLPGEQAGITAALGETARIADEGGASWFTLMDHWFQMEMLATSQDPMMEGYTSLGFLAGQTRQIKLGLLVTGVTYRHPGLLAKIVTTLDVLSGGRAILGLGAAWYEREHLGLGVPYPAVSERFERLEETLQICRQMWSADDGPYTGKHYQLAETICYPKPVQATGPMVLIGGGGERKTLRLVAKYAGACNLFGTSVDEVKAKLDILRGHCDAEGTDYDAITKTIMGAGDPFAEPDKFLALMEEYAAIGVSHIQIMPMGPDPVGLVSGLMQDVAPRLAQIGA
jgi:F420-dependent oxidoreductase-like protein